MVLFPGAVPGFFILDLFDFIHLVNVSLVSLFNAKSSLLSRLFKSNIAFILIHSVSMGLVGFSDIPLIHLNIKHITPLCRFLRLCWLCALSRVGRM